MLKSIYIALSVAVVFTMSVACKSGQQRGLSTGQQMNMGSNSNSGDAVATQSTGEGQNQTGSNTGTSNGNNSNNENTSHNDNHNGDHSDGQHDDNDEHDDFEPPQKKGPGKFVEDFKSSSQFFTMMNGPVKGQSPHGTVQIWYSKNLKKVIKHSKFMAPEGTVAIKTFKNDDKEGIVVMIKKKDGYDDDNSNWRYEMRSRDGELLEDPEPGRNAKCISCHSSAAAKDYLAGTEFGQDFDEDIDPDTGKDDQTPGQQPADKDDLEKGPGKFSLDFNQKGSDFFTQTKKFVQGKSPHGKVRIWYSSNIKHVLGNAKMDVPPGTVAIKEFDNDKDPGVDGVAVMIKKEKGYNPDNGDWYYEMRDQWGTLLDDPAPGKIEKCQACHAAAAATDHLAGTKVHSADQNSDKPGMFKSDYYDSKDFFTQSSKLVKGSSPHGSTQIWYSSNLKELIGKSKFDAPVGSVAIKRFEKDEKQGLAVMIKMEAGFDKENGDWRYEMRDRYGNLLKKPKAGPVPMCSGCHDSFAKTDYLGGTRIKD